MKSKFVLTIYKHSAALQSVSTLVASHNEGVIQADLNDFIGLVHIHRLMYPISYYKTVSMKKGNQVFISDDNFETYSLIVSLLEDSAKEIGNLSVDKDGIVKPKFN